MIYIRALNIVFITIIITILSISDISAAKTLRQGDRGEDVRHLQEILWNLGYLHDEPDGVFGGDTSKAVVGFQADHGLQADGVYGVNTQRVLESIAASTTAASRSRTAEKVASTRSAGQASNYTVSSGDSLWSISRRYGLTSQKLADYNGLRLTDTLSVGAILKLPADAAVPDEDDSQGSIELLSWQQADATIPVGRTFIVTDVKTGRSFQAMRRGGDWHADSEPLTASDTAAFSAICSGVWSWDRRGVIITLGSRKLAASINCMPHGSDHISGNNFDGMFCIHFLGSRVHGSGLVDPDHQAMILAAAGHKI